jgi:hypothetical protein
MICRPPCLDDRTSRRRAATCDGCSAGFNKGEIKLAQSAALIGARREHCDPPEIISTLPWLKISDVLKVDMFDNAPK